MNKSKLSEIYKIIVAVMAMLGIIIYFYAFPTVGKSIVNAYPEFSQRYLPWLVFIWITGIPCYAVLSYVWKIADSVGKNKAFVKENAVRFKRISQLAFLDSVFLTFGNLVLLFMNMNHPSVLILSLGISFIGIAISVTAYGLSYLTQNAAELQEQSDLTI